MKRLWFLFLIASTMAMGQQINPGNNVRWPVSCLTPGTVYSPQANACVASGGTPAPPNFAVQLNNSGAFGADSNITINPTAHIFAAPEIHMFSTVANRFMLRIGEPDTITNNKVMVFGFDPTSTTGNIQTLQNNVGFGGVLALQANGGTVSVPRTGGTFNLEAVDYGTLNSAIGGVQTPLGYNANIQAAVGTGPVNTTTIIPQAYQGTDNFTNSQGNPVIDLRFPSTTAPNNPPAAWKRSVREWGARCDGVTDDTAALQAALDWAANSSHGMILTVPAGLCKTHMLNYRGQSIEGVSAPIVNSSNSSGFSGFPGEDILRMCDPNTCGTNAVLDYFVLRNLYFSVDKSVNASWNNPANPTRNPDFQFRYVGMGFAAAPPNPGLPTMVVNGTPGTTGYSYLCTSLPTTGGETRGKSAMVYNGPATLNGTNNITITCPAVTPSAPENIYRVSGFGTNGTSSGLLATVANGGSTTDTGAVLTGGSPGAPTAPAWYAGNCAVAAPDVSGNAIHLIQGAKFENITIIGSGGTSNNDTCGIYLQQLPYDSHFKGITMKNVNYGFVVTYPSTNVATSWISQQPSADGCSYENFNLATTHNFTDSVGGAHIFASNIQLYTRNEDRSQLAKDIPTGLLMAGNDWNINDLYIETFYFDAGGGFQPYPANSVITQIQGTEHNLNGGFSATTGGGIFQIDADDVSGNHTVLFENVINNGQRTKMTRLPNITADNGSGSQLYSTKPRQYGYSPFSEHPWKDNPGKIDMDFLRTGNTANPYYSLADLFLTPEQFLFQKDQGVNPPLDAPFDLNTPIISDSTVPITQRYMLIKSPAQFATYSASSPHSAGLEGVTPNLVATTNSSLGFGFNRVPKTTMTMYLALKSSVNTTQTWSILGSNPSVTAPYGSAALSLTTSWQIFSIPVDTTSATSNDIQFSTSTTSPNADVQMAWIALVPTDKRITPASIAVNGVALPTSSIAANTCTATSTATATGAATTSVISSVFASDPTAVTGWGASGGLTLRTWPTANTINYSVCNQTASPITPGAVNVNFRVLQ